MNPSQESHARHYVILTQEILEDDRMTITEKLVLARISGFDIFFESAEETAEKIHVHPDRVRKAKQHLTKLGLIEEINNTGRGKQYVATFLDGMRLDKLSNQTGQIVQSDWANCPPENKKRIKRELKEKQTKEKADGSEQQFGNPDVNAMLDAWAEATGFDLKNQKMERYAMSGLIKSHGLDATKALVERVKRARRSEDRFAPQIAKPSQLRGKYSKLEALTMWEERQAKDAKALHRANPIRIYQQAQPEPTDDGPDTPEAKAERQRITKELKAKLFAKLNGGCDD